MDEWNLFMFWFFFSRYIGFVLCLCEVVSISRVIFGLGKIDYWWVVLWIFVNFMLGGWVLCMIIYV